MSDNIVDAPNGQLPNFSSEKDEELIRAAKDPVFLNTMALRFEDLGTTDASNNVYELNAEASLAENRYKEIAKKLCYTFFDVAGISPRENNQPCLICDVTDQNHSDYCKGLTRVQHFELVYEKFNEVFDTNLKEAFGYDAVMKIIHFLEQQDKEKEVLEALSRVTLNDPETEERIGQKRVEMDVRHRMNHRLAEDVRSDQADAEIDKAMEKKNGMLAQFRGYLEKLDKETDGKKFTSEDQFPERSEEIVKLLELKNIF